MKSTSLKLFLCLAVAGLPAVLYSFASGPVVRRTGAEVDGGLDCAACHRNLGPANSDPAGRIRIEAINYKPGTKQTVRVVLEHPEAMRWGFQLTARLASDLTRQAGTFSGSDDVQIKCDNGTLQGSNAPCNGLVEFAEHTAAGTRPGTPGSRTFEVEWTPPSAEAGDVVFYASGNAANNNNNNQGDRIYTTSLRLASDSCTLTERPSLRGVVNAASFQSPIAMNTIVTLTGLNFQAPGRTRLAGRADFVDGRFPAELACVAVEIDGRRAPILYVQNDQINVQAPTFIGAGPLSARVILNPGRPNELRSDPVVATSQNHAPAFFLFPGNSIAALVAGTATPVANSASVPTGRPARPGELVSLFGTGFGPTEPVYQAGETAPGPARIRDPLTVTVGGTILTAADVLYAGLSPGSISGLYQFDIRLPQTLSDGDVVVSIRIGGVETARATIPVRR